MKLIDKDALVSEIDERIKTWKEYYDEMHDAECHELASGAYLRMCELKDFKKFLNSLDMKEVDLNKEFNNFLDNIVGMPRLWHPNKQIEWGECIAKHFFELGLKARQG